MNIKVDCDEVTRFRVKLEAKSKKINEEVAKVIARSSLMIQREAKENLKANKSVKTGHLRRMVATKISDTEGEIHTSNVKYARYVEEGTRAHIIRAKKKKYLYWEGASHPVKQVKHPGSAKKPYLIPAFEKEKPKFIRDLEELIDLE